MTVFQLFDGWYDFFEIYSNLLPPHQPMNQTLFDELPLTEKAAFVQEQGQFIEAQDFYSFFILVYLCHKRHIKLLYDFSGKLVSVEIADEISKESFLAEQLQTSLGDAD